MRDKQAKAFDFIKRMLDRGIRDIIISAPTGSGKSVIGTTLGLWAAQSDVRLGSYSGGAYYLCTQKLLQDQLEHDVNQYPPHLRSLVSLKSASEYPCRNKQFGDCATGLMHKPICAAFPDTCTYIRQKKAYKAAGVGITNYAYFFTEQAYSESFTGRKLLIADEAHTLEQQLLRFVELEVGPEDVRKYTPTLRDVPVLDSLEDFTAWLEKQFLSTLAAYLEGFDSDELTPTRARLKKDLENQLAKGLRALEGMTVDPDNWIYWQETAPNAQRTSFAKPLSAARYFTQMLQNTSEARIYMSAYPGSKDVFCRTMGLDPTRVAMLTLGSVFPKEHRPINILSVGSMGKKSQASVLPSFLRCLKAILSAHPTEKGIVHCHSYALGMAIFDFFKDQAEQQRLLFPRNANERNFVYEKHRKGTEPSVILSPSFTEGFDFADGAARWQVIAKIPFPYLGDRQISAKKDLDPEWYAMRTVMTVIQASGRICRNEQDHGVTYITDSDFSMLWDRYEYMFPPWWKEAVHWH